MAMVSGLAARNFGRAVSETADALDRGRINAEDRAHRERLLDKQLAARSEELDRRLDAKLDEILLRYGAAAGRYGARTARGGAPEYSDEQLAALGNMNMQEFAEGRQYQTTGKLPQRPAFTTDDEGLPFVDAEGKPMAPLTADYEARPRLERLAARYRRGIVHAAMDPADVDDFEKGQALATARDLAFDDDPRKVERARLGQRAMEGKDRFTVAGDEKIDEAEGFRGPTDVGRSRIDENRAQAERARADAADRAPGGGKALSEAIKTVDAQRKTLQGERTNLRMQRDSELRNATGRAAKQRIADDYAERERDLDRRLEDLDRQYDELRRKQGLPARGAAADSSQTGDAPPVSMLKEGIRTRFANGQVWTLRGGKPVRVQ